MRERPILFSGAMVRAILEDRKTQTRRICKAGERISAAFEFVGSSPYGAAGDQLWVRETGWERPERTPRMMREGADTWAPYYYDADGLTPADHEQFKEWGFKRRPSIYMPRWASRITLEVTGVRVERLHHITEADAIAEGMPSSSAVSARAIFEDLWEDLNAPRGYGWDVNPWVWAVSFRRLP